MSFFNDLSFQEDVLPMIDYTVTKYGYDHLVSTLSQITVSEHELLYQQQIIRQLVDDQTRVKRLSHLLWLIHEKEPDISWLQSSLEQDKTDQFHLPISFLNQSIILHGYNFVQIYGSTLIVLFYLIGYVYAKYYLKFPLSIGQYFSDIVANWTMVAEIGVSFVINNRKCRNFMAIVLVNIYIFFQLFQTYHNINGSLVHYKECKQFQDRYRHLRQAVQLIGKIRSVCDINHVISDDYYNLKKYINDTSYFGEELVSHINRFKYQENLTVCLKFIGEIDVLVNSAKLVLKHGYSIPKLIQNNNKPRLDIKQLFHPKLSRKNVKVANDLLIDKQSVMIITGANTSGKSTLMKALMIAIVMGQTIGVVPAESMSFTLFHNLHTYLNIPDTVGKESLYEAEMNKCLEHLNQLDKMDKSQFSFSIIDELFTGTNPIDGISGSYSVCKQFPKYKNALHIISTHFKYICRLGTEYPDQFVNKQFKIQFLENKDKDKINVIRDYILYDGISNQNIGVKLLKIKGFSQNVVDVANDVMQKIQNKINPFLDNDIIDDH